MIIDTVIDLAILLLPIRYVFTLQLPRKIKLAIAGIFALGGFVMVTSVLRLVYLYACNTWLELDIYVTSRFWTTVHISAAVLCASLPIHKPLGTSILTSVSRLYGRCAKALSSFLCHGNKKEDLERGSLRHRGQEHE
jgi:hypothetical protein